MEKRMTLQMNTPQSAINSIMTTIRTMTGSMQAPMEWLRSYYSHCIGKEINMSQTWLITRTQVAFILAAFTTCPLLMRVAFAAWFLLALLRCKKEI